MNLFQGGSKSLILLIKRGFTKKLLYSGNFNSGKDFRQGQKMQLCFFHFVNELWLLSDFVLKKCGFKIILKVLRKKS